MDWSVSDYDELAVLRLKQENASNKLALFQAFIRALPEDFGLHQIHQRLAYEMWEIDNCRHGNDLLHWEITKDDAERAVWEHISDALDQFGRAVGVHVGVMAQIIRIAITGKYSGAPLPSVIMSLGKSTIIDRLQFAIDNFQPAQTGKEGEKVDTTSSPSFPASGDRRFRALNN